MGPMSDAPRRVPHFFQPLPGWMYFRAIYDEEIKRAASGAVFVELGAYCGKSLAYLAVEIHNSGKDIAVHSYDLWNGWQRQWSRDKVENLFVQNFRRMGATSPVTFWTKDSAKAAKGHDDASVDFVFADAGHTLECVQADISAWWPKIKPGGTFAGDDYKTEFPDVKTAVDAFFKELDVPVEVIGTSWRVRKP